MLLYIVIFCVVLLFAFICLEYVKRRNYDIYIQMEISLDFPNVIAVKHSGKHGFMLFQVKEVQGNFRALMINKVKVNNDAIRLRSFDQIYTKLPLAVGGTLLSIGIRKSSGATKAKLEHCKVMISGYLLDNKDKKVPFKKTLRAYYTQMEKVV